jgi:hypothetical protein
MQSLTDVDAFSAVIHVLRNGEGRPRNISIDVRPLRTLPPAMEVTAETRLPASAEELGARRAIATRAAFPIGDAEVPANCGGMLSPDESGEFHRGCPQSATSEYVIALAAAPRYDSTPAALAQRPPPGWYLRVIATSINRNGYSQRVDDILLEKKAGKWSVAKVYTVAFIE